MKTNELSNNVDKHVEKTSLDILLLGGLWSIDCLMIWSDFPSSDYSSRWFGFTNLHHYTDQSTWDSQQNHVFYKPAEPDCWVPNPGNSQNLLQPKLLLQNQTLDGLAGGVHKRQHQEHGQDGSNGWNETAGMTRADLRAWLVLKKVLSLFPHSLFLA